MRAWFAATVMVVTVSCSEGGSSSPDELDTAALATASAPSSTTTVSDAAVTAAAPPTETPTTASGASGAPTTTAAPTTAPTTPPPTTSAVPTAPAPIATPAPTASGAPVTRLAPTTTRFLFETDGEPFFWLADTAWALPFALDRDEVRLYLDTRASQGFNVVQTIAILNLDGWPGPNRYGDAPIDGDVSRLVTTAGADPADADQYDFWDHLDQIVAGATARDMYVALVPIWAGSTDFTEVINTRTAASYGSFLGSRYGDRRVIWMLGGDAPADGMEELWRALARGIETGASSAGDASATITYHPLGLQSSAQWFHHDPWLDFNMIQGGHCLRFDVRAGLILDSYQRAPAKPFIDGEPLYEGHPYCWDEPPDGISTALDVRREAYYSVFAGAAGHTYGHNTVYQFLRPGEPPRTGASGEWTTALHAAGGEQMRHLKALMQSRPFTTGVPDDSIIRSGQGAGAYHLVGTRAADGAYLMVYSPIGTPYEVDLELLAGDVARLWWFNPRPARPSSSARHPPRRRSWSPHRPRTTGSSSRTTRRAASGHRAPEEPCDEGGGGVTA